MKVYITATYKEGKNKTEIEQLCKIIKDSGFEDFCFIRDVENYKKVFNDPKELMNRARMEVLKCDVIFFDATERSTGRLIEVGMAFANGKKVIVIMKEGTEIKDTLKGVAYTIITYNKIEDIQEPLRNLYLEWTNT